MAFWRASSTCSSVGVLQFQRIPLMVAFTNLPSDAQIQALDILIDRFSGVRFRGYGEDIIGEHGHLFMVPSQYATTLSTDKHFSSPAS